MTSIIDLSTISLYRGETEILHNISWTINKGEHWALVGPNGCGKTTLLKIISGNLWPSSGTVHVLGKKFGETDLRELKKKIGWVSSYLTEKVPSADPIVDIVVSGKSASFGLYQPIDERDREKARDLLKLLHIEYLADRTFPVISQGERQRVLIARALMAQPLLLILDEPCTGLDPKARSELLDSVSTLCKKGKTTVIYVTHHMEEIVPEITQCLMVKQGKEFRKGAPQELITKEILEELFEYKHS